MAVQRFQKHAGQRRVLHLLFVDQRQGGDLAAREAPLRVPEKCFSKITTPLVEGVVFSAYLLTLWYY